MSSPPALEVRKPLYAFWRYPGYPGGEFSGRGKRALRAHWTERSRKEHDFQLRQRHLYNPTQGNILFQGQDITGLRAFKIAHKGIARTFQNIALFHHMTVLDNLLLGRNPYLHAGVLRGGFFFGKALREELESRKDVEVIIDFLEIERFRKQIVGALPFGIQRRIELGRALAMKPKVLLLDEPVSGMNSEAREDKDEGSNDDIKIENRRSIRCIRTSRCRGRGGPAPVRR